MRNNDNVSSIIIVVASVLIPVSCDSGDDDISSNCKIDIIDQSKQNIISITILIMGVGSNCY